MRLTAQKDRIRAGVGQLTLVEHSLCPLDASRSLVDNLAYRISYRYSDSTRKRRTARVRVFSPLGLSAGDELYLWGLLALTCSQSELRPELRATPHWCLRQLGVIDQKTRRGGRQYQQFADALRRLSAVTYLSDAFYDPVRAEHRNVSFHFLSYSLPANPESSRAWRIVWDPVFFEMSKHSAGRFSFDLSIYRQLDPATRRLFLFASKILYRRSTLPTLELRQLAVDVLGFAPCVATRDLRMKTLRCLRRLGSLEVLDDFSVTRTSRGEYIVRARRGDYFASKPSIHDECKPLSPIAATLVDIGFEPEAAARLVRRYPARVLEEWADITQAAQERFGAQFFRKSPMAYLVDSVSKAARGQRTPPDWWHELRQRESAKRELTDESRQVFERIRAEIFAGSESDLKSAETGVPIRARDVLAEPRERSHKNKFPLVVQ